MAGPMNEMTDEDTIIGVTTRKAAQVVGVSVRRLAAWHRSGLLPPHRSVHVGDRTVRIYRLDDLVEACIIKTLEDRGCSLRQIRRVVEAHRSDEAPRPLRNLRWATDVEGIYVRYDNGAWFGGRVPAQGVMHETINLDEVRTRARSRALSRAGVAGKVEQRDRTMGRKPVFAGTRTPVEAVHTYMRRGIPDDEILEAFPHLEHADLETARELLSA